MIIQKAQRKAVKLKLAITGLTGSGKTMGAILLAKGLASQGKILVIDTENQSASLYSDHPITKHIDYDVLNIDAPFTVDKYLKALSMGVEAGYEVIVIDSISHQWDAEGGSMDKKHTLDMKGGNSFTNWRGIKKEANTFQSKLLSAPVHIVVTMRSKMEYVLETNEKGKQTPRKVGLAPVQMDGIEYEFTTVFDMSADKTYSITKDRTGLFEGKVERISEKTGQQIKEWLSSGKEEVKASTAELFQGSTEVISIDQVSKITELISQAGSDSVKLLAYYKIASWYECPIDKYETIKNGLLKKINEKSSISDKAQYLRA
jgi:hypothetical protein